MAEWGEDADTALAIFKMDCVVEEGGCGVADQWGEEDQRDDQVLEMVVLLQL